MTLVPLVITAINNQKATAHIESINKCGVIDLSDPFAAIGSVQKARLALAERGNRPQY
jgi:hypothetical protein